MPVSVGIPTNPIYVMLGDGGDRGSFDEKVLRYQPFGNRTCFLLFGAAISYARGIFQATFFGGERRVCARGLGSCASSYGRPQ